MRYNAEDIKKGRDILNNVLELFKDRSKWTQGEQARDRLGDRIPPTSPSATCWCIEGAVMKFDGGNLFSNLAWRAISNVSENFGSPCPFVINDVQGYDVTIALLQEAQRELDRWEQE